jgi:hypothetical protein
MEMDGYDAETYLRLRAEQSLLAGGSCQVDYRLAGSARALAAVGVIDIELARRVVEDYTRARVLRGRYDTHPTAVTRSALAAPRRIVGCGHVINVTVGRLTVRYAVFDPAETRLALTLTLDDAQEPDPVEDHPAAETTETNPAITVTDDRGTSVTSSDLSVESDSEREWRGFLTLRPALNPGTRWIELLGERVEFPPDHPDLTVTIENFTDADAMDRYLAQCLTAVGNQPQSDSIGPAIEALRVAGLLEHHGVSEMMMFYQALRGPGPVAVKDEPWRSLSARRGATGGPRGTLLLGVTTPRFGGISVTLLDLVSADGGFRCGFELGGPADLGTHHDPGLSGTFVTFAGLDDRGNFYLGDTDEDECVGGGGTASGTLSFWPALDPQATRLDLIVTTDRARALINVPLTWEDTP